MSAHWSPAGESQNRRSSAQHEQSAEVLRLTLSLSRRGGRGDLAP